MEDAPTTSSTDASAATRETGTFTVKRGLADMLRGGVIMDVVTAEHARIAEDAGAVSVMALERVPAEKRAMNSLSCAIFFSRWAFCDSKRERIWVFARTISSYPPLYVMIVS